MTDSQTRFVAAPDQISSPVGSETVLLQLSGGAYFGLNAVGSTIWRRLQQPASVADLVAEVVAEYDVSPERCEADVRELLAQLQSTGLIRVADEPEHNSQVPVTESR